MSGFARRLVVRARGGQSAAFARPRRAPRFVPATAAGESPADGVLITAIGAEAPAGPEAAPRTAPAGDKRPAELREAHLAAAPVPAQAVTSGRELPAQPLAPRPGGTWERGAPSAPPAPHAPARPAVHAAVKAAVARPSAPAQADTGLRRRSARTVRATSRPPAPLPATSAAAAPRVEVRIGRVEVAAPAPADTPAPPTRTLRAPAAQRSPTPRPAVPAFGELAAARRHVDRIAR